MKIAFGFLPGWLRLAALSGAIGAWTVAGAGALMAAQQAQPGAAPTASALEPAEHGLTQSPVEIFHLGAFPITNSMIVTWLVALALIIFARLAMRTKREVPSGAQNFWGPP